MRGATLARDPYATRRAPRFAPQPEHKGLVRRRPLTGCERMVAAHNYHLVAEVCASVSHKFPWSFGPDERESAGALGLMDAARLWRNGAGASFKTFAKRRIWGAIMDEAREVDWVTRKARREERETGVPAVTMVAVDHEDDEGNARGLGTRAVDPRPACSVERDRIDASDELRAVLARAQLDFRERSVLELRAEGRTLAQVGAELGVSESRACQLERKATNTVRWWHGLKRDETTHTRFGRGAT